MNKIIITTLFLITIFGVFDATAVSAHPGRWVDNVYGNFSDFGGSGRPAVAQVTNHRGSAVTVTLRCYKEFVPRYQAGWLSQQVLFDTTAITLNPNETRTISANTAGCLTQCDVYNGDGVTSFYNDDPASYPTIMDGVESIDSALCTKCSNACTLGQNQCVGNGWQTCMTGADGCTIWSGTTLCDANQICAAGSCVNTCQPSTCSMLGYQCGTFSDGCGGILICGTCSSNQTCTNGHCVTNCQPQTCSQAGRQCGAFSDGCGNTLNCGTCYGNQTCQNGTCVSSCQNQCQAGDRRCSGNGYQVCGNYDGNGCYVWGQTVICGGNQQCQNGDCIRIKENLSINLSANPQSGCAPLQNVGLRATVNRNYDNYNNYGNNNYDSNYGQLTYRFDCDSDGTWDKTVTTSDTDVVVNDLCDYQNPGNYTARVRVESDGTSATDSVVIEAQNCNHYQPIIIPPVTPVETLQIQKTVSDLSNGTGYQPAVTASANDTVSFRIAVSSDSSCQAVIINDIIPAGISNIRDLRIDGVPVNGDIVSGIAIGNLAGGQQRIVTFTATVSGPAYFPFGQTTLTDTATARNGNLSNSSSASVYVWRQAVLGATRVSTGITDSPWFEYLIAAISGLLISSILFRKEIAAFIRKPIAGDKKRRESSKAELRNVILKLRAK